MESTSDKQDPAQNQNAPKLKLKIREIQFRTHAHATEVVSKVKECLKRLSTPTFDEKLINLDNLAGSYGNPIRALSLKFSVKNDIEGILNNFRNLLTLETKQHLLRNFENHLDEKLKFYFRIDKQSLATGSIVLAEGSDIIRVVISIQNKDPRVIVTPDMVKQFLITNQLLS